MHLLLLLLLTLAATVLQGIDTYDRTQHLWGNTQCRTAGTAITNLDLSSG